MSTETIAFIGVLGVLIPLWRIAARIDGVADNVAAIRRMLSERYPDPDEDDADPHDKLP